MRYIFLVLMSCLTFMTSPVYASVMISPSQNSSSGIMPTDISGEERKPNLKMLKKKLRDFKKNRRAEDQKVLLAILAILLPPLAVYLHQNAFNGKFWLSLILTFCFWIPGVIYALLVVLEAI